MHLKENVKPPKGVLHMECRDQDGNLVWQRTLNNLIVATGRQQIARLLGAAESSRRIASIAFGTNGTAAQSTDTAITGAFTKTLGSPTYPTSTSISFPWTLGGSEANGMEIREFGLLTQGGTLFSRLTSALITKQEGWTITGTWTLIF